MAKPPGSEDEPAIVYEERQIPRGYVSGGGLVPVPDPTVLTTSQLRQAIDSLQSLMESRIAGNEALFKVLKEQVDRRHVDITEAITHARELISSNIANVSANLEKLAAVSDERFERIDTQFTERDKRTDQLSLADKTAVAAALQAAKEAVGAQNTSNSIAIAKSESSTVESIKQLQTLFNGAIASLNDKINDVKSRLDRGEGHVKGGSDTWGYIVGGVGMLIGLLSVVLLAAKVVT